MLGGVATGIEVQLVGISLPKMDRGTHKADPFAIIKARLPRFTVPI